MSFKLEDIHFDFLLGLHDKANSLSQELDIAEEVFCLAHCVSQYQPLSEVMC